MSEFLMYLTNGIVIGVINAISAIGVSLIVGIMKVVNFAHGELYIFAGYFSYHLSDDPWGSTPSGDAPFRLLHLSHRDRDGTDSDSAHLRG